ncbi:hypothetical protein SNE25_08350 [Mucilaginibacter sabulilitoris]|uniref:SMP-30/Gluconolactonase/LRE-like region domain-containing protein n=1 Tax=Mucilaginibacter sabulilitoris TaxID=1173583 RepID=A0ABZ0TQX4_9SPHI|nr:hypothetical protein [Mucilaginibacter sabulilitoris]WPU95531.1 hypothetical protein SNE25_08350 [Mucilaginibacter sabulilitoris]
MKRKTCCLFICGLVFLQIFEGCKKDSLQTPSSIDVQKTSMENHSGALADSSGYTVSTMISNGPGLRGICTADDGTVYSAATDDNKIYKISPQGVLTLIVSFPPKIYPLGLKLAANGYLYSILDSSKFYRILKMTTTGVIVAKMAIHNVKVHTPSDLAVGDDGTIYIADAGDQRIVAITPDGKSGSVLAGRAGFHQVVDGKGDKAGLDGLVSIKFLKDGYLVASEQFSSYTGLRKITRDGNVTTIFSLPGDAQRQSYISDFSASHRDKNMKVTAKENFFLQMTTFTAGEIRNNIVHLSDKNVMTNITGENAEGITNGPGENARFANFFGMAIFGTTLYISCGSVDNLRKIIKN